MKRTTDARHRLPGRMRCSQPKGGCYTNAVRQPPFLSQFSKIVPIKTASLRYAVCGCCLCIKNANCYSSDESAKAQPAAQQEEEQRFTQHRQPQALAQDRIPPVDVPFGAGAHAGFTRNALPAAQAAFLQLQADRALLLAGIAVRDAALALPVQPRKRQHRQQGEHRSHGQKN